MFDSSEAVHSMFVSVFDNVEICNCSNRHSKQHQTADSILSVPVTHHNLLVLLYQHGYDQM